MIKKTYARNKDMLKKLGYISEGHRREPKGLPLAKSKTIYSASK